MPILDPSAREIHFKVVYTGPPLAGRTTNVQHLYRHTPPDARAALYSLVSETGCTTTCAVLESSAVHGLRARFNLFTIPGPAHDPPTRQAVLRDVDGLVFVADSQRDRADANLESFAQLAADLAVHGRRLADVPLVLQYNKRDLPDILSLPELDASLAASGRPRHEAVASRGEGVLATFESVCALLRDRTRAGA